MLRRLAKTGIACGLHWSGADLAIGRLSGRKRRPLIIGYHRVLEDLAATPTATLPGMVVSRKTLEKQLDWIGQRYRFVSLDELGPALAAGDGHVAAVTFDDGYADVYENAFPLLERKGIPAAFFVVTGVIGTSDLMLYDRLYLALQRAFVHESAFAVLDRFGPPLRRQIARRLRDQGPFGAFRALLESFPLPALSALVACLESEYGLDEQGRQALRSMTWEMLKTLSRAGMTVGSHTRGHALLTLESPERVAEEAEASREEIERQLHVPVRHLAYPDGRCDADTVRAVAAAGYRFGYLTCEHHDPEHPLLTLPRRMLWENSSADLRGAFSTSIMSCQVNGVFDFASRCTWNHGWRRASGVASARQARPGTAV